MMDHAEAARKLLAEQYLLGELSEPEREEFERHFFSCAECAEAVETGATFVANTKAVLAEGNAFANARSKELKRRWFRGEWSLPTAAALAGWAMAAVLGGYRYFHSGIESDPLTLASAVPVRAVRASQPLTFSRQRGIIALTVAREWEGNYTAYQAEIERADDRRLLLSGRFEAAGSAGEPLAVSIRPQGLQTGSYFLVLYGLGEGAAQGVPLERISFTLTE